MKIYFEDCDKKFQPKEFEQIKSKYKNDFKKFAKEVYSKSFFSTNEKITDFLNNYKAKDYKKMLLDSLYHEAIPSH